MGNLCWTDGQTRTRLVRLVQRTKHYVRVTGQTSQSGTFATEPRGPQRLVVQRTGEVPGTDQPSERGEYQAWKDEPQPQVPETFGLPNLKPEPWAPST